MMHWDPFAELNRISQHLAQRNTEDHVARPLVDIREEQNAFVVHAEMPGVKPEDVHVEVERGVLTIRGERKFTTDEATQKQYRRVERHYGVVERSFSLPNDIDPETVNAKLEHGILEVRAPKKPAATPRRIAVSG
jgi:HSP20 family protein